MYRLDVEHAIARVAVAAVVGVDLELPVAAAARRDLVLPHAVVQRVEVVLEDEAREARAALRVHIPVPHPRPA